MSFELSRFYNQGEANELDQFLFTRWYLFSFARLQPSFWCVSIGSWIIGKKGLYCKRMHDPKGWFRKTQNNRKPHLHRTLPLPSWSGGIPFFAFSLVERFLTMEEVNNHCMLRILQNDVFSCKIFALQILFDTLNLSSLIWNSSKNGTYH